MNEFEYKEHRIIPWWIVIASVAMILGLLIAASSVYILYKAYESGSLDQPNDTPAYSQPARPEPSYRNRQYNGSGDETIYFSTGADGLVSFSAAQIFPNEDLFQSNFQAFVYRMSDGRKVFTAVNCIGHCKSERTKYMNAGDYFIEMRGDDGGEWQLIITALHE